MRTWILPSLITLILMTDGALAIAAEPLPVVIERVNTKLVKLFGASGFRGIANYGTGVVISPDGYILTASTQMLDAAEIVVHTWDGLKFIAVVVASEPQLDVALLKIVPASKKREDPIGIEFDYFDFDAAAARPLARPGDWVLAFSNQFEIAMRDEPLTVQKGVIASVSKLTGRRGIFEFPYSGNVYVVDQITNNPGAAGGALTDRHGNWIGIIGKEIKNTLTESWLNYALPLNASMTINDRNQSVTVSLPQFVKLAREGKYQPVQRPANMVAQGVYHGIVFVPNVVERTPPYVEEVLPDSPAQRAGLQTNDLISFADGEPIGSIQAFHDWLRRTVPGQRIRLELRRGDRLVSVELELAAPPTKPGARPTTEPNP